MSPQVRPAFRNERSDPESKVPDGQGADITLSGFVYRKQKAPSTSEGYFGNYPSTASTEIKKSKKFLHLSQA